MMRLLGKAKGFRPLRELRFSVDCPSCGDPIIRQEGQEFVLKARVIKFPVGEGLGGIAKCKTCKSWVNIPVTLDMK